jgi:peptidoglycan/LPS O-acetylase OafA/YrhL
MPLAQQQPAVPVQHKMLGLEVIRFISALAVLIWHYQHFSYIADTPTNYVASHPPFYGIFRIFYEHGLYGVQVFWAISGFIFSWKYRDAIADQAITARKFFVLRFSRLYPLHIATLLLVIGLQAAYLSENGFYFVYQQNDLVHFVLQIFLASDWGLLKGYSFNGPIWSISVEVLIYLVFFVTLRNVGKSWLINVVILVACLAFKALRISTPVIDCLAFFYVGGLSAMLYRHLQHHRQRNLMLGMTALLLIVAAVLAGTTALGHMKFFPFFFLISCMPILLLLAAQNIRVPSPLQRSIEAAGNMTYASYLIHFPIQLSAALYFIHIEQPIPYSRPDFFIGFIGLTLVASYFIYRFFELPMQNLLRSKLSGRASVLGTQGPKIAG